MWEEHEAPTCAEGSRARASVLLVSSHPGTHQNRSTFSLTGTRDYRFCTVYHHWTWYLWVTSFHHWELVMKNCCNDRSTNPHKMSQPFFRVRAHTLGSGFWEAMEDIQRFCARNKEIMKVSSGHGTLMGGIWSFWTCSSKETKTSFGSALLNHKASIETSKSIVRYPTKWMKLSFCEMRVSQWVSENRNQMSDLCKSKGNFDDLYDLFRFVSSYSIGKTCKFFQCLLVCMFSIICFLFQSTIPALYQ